MDRIDEWTRVRWGAMVIVGLLLAGAARAGRPEFAHGFEHPPRDCGMVPFWSWNGTLTPEEVCRQIDLFEQQGVHGAFMHARAGLDESKTPYFSDGWWRAVKAAVEHGREVGFKTWIYDEDKWPSGSAGGRVLERNPIRNARKGLRVVERDVKGPTLTAIRVPGARWVIAARLTGAKAVDPSSLTDVTAFNDSDAPAISTAATRGLRVTIVRGTQPCLLVERCKALGCAATVLKLGTAPKLDECDVLISDVGAVGAGVPDETLRAWIGGGGGYVDFSHSEGGAGLYRLDPVVLEDAPDHR